MRGSRRVSVPAASLAVVLVVVLIAYGYEFSLPMQPIVLLPTGTVVKLTGPNQVVFRAWNVTGKGGQLVGTWIASNWTHFLFSPTGPTRILIPVMFACGGRFDVDLPQGGYILVWRTDSETTLTVLDTLEVLPSEHMVPNMHSGPDNGFTSCASG